MELLNKVKTELEKSKNYDFASEIFDGEILTIVYDVVYATEDVLKSKNNISKLSSIEEFMLSMGFEKTEKQNIFKHKYFVNEHYIEFDLSACALEKWAVMQNIFVKLLSVGESLKATEICNVLGVAQHSIFDN